MEEKHHQPECAEEKTQRDKNNNNQIVDTALKENVLPEPETEEKTSKDQNGEAETEEKNDKEEPKHEDEKGQHQSECEEAKNDTKQDGQNNTPNDAAASEAVSTSAENTERQVGTEEETPPDTKQRENKRTDNEGKAKETVPHKTDKKKTSKGKDTEGKSDGNKRGKTEEAGKAAMKKPVPSASSLAALSRPRTSARSSRASNKKDLIAKFQQGAPETPVQRNFKLQRSATAGSTGASIKQKILQWCISKTRNYEGVSIENFSSSWCDGMAFCALIHRFFPDAFDFNSLDRKEREKNFTLAFQTAETLADCFPLLDVPDMLLMGNHPDPMCVFTYVQSLCHSLSKIEKQRKDKAEKENSGKKDEDEPQEETGTRDGGTSEGAEVTQVIKESHRETSEKEDHVLESEETDIQATGELES